MHSNNLIICVEYILTLPKWFHQQNYRQIDTNVIEQNYCKNLKFGNNLYHGTSEPKLFFKQFFQEWFKTRQTEDCN